MKNRHLLCAGLLALAGFTNVEATTVIVLPNGSWNPFDISDIGSTAGDLNWYDINDGSALSFSVTVAAGQIGTLTVVDAGFSGDMFSVSANGNALALTTAAVNSYPASIGLDFDGALADAKFSRGTYGLNAGTYLITGTLNFSALDDMGAPLNATVGALRLEVAPIPEASTLAMLLAGLGLVGGVVRRRAS